VAGGRLPAPVGLVARRSSPGEPDGRDCGRSSSLAPGQEIAGQGPVIVLRKLRLGQVTPSPVGSPQQLDREAEPAGPQSSACRDRNRREAALAICLNQQIQFLGETGQKGCRNQGYAPRRGRQHKTPAMARLRARAQPPEFASQRGAHGCIRFRIQPRGRTAAAASRLRAKHPGFDAAQAGGPQLTVQCDQLQPRGLLGLSDRASTASVADRDRCC